MTPTNPRGDGRRAAQSNPRAVAGKRRGVTLAGLASAAVVAVYGAGYFHTQSAADQVLAQGGSTTSTAASSSPATPQATPPVLSRTGSTGSGTSSRPAPATPTTPPAAAQTVAYKDGSYSGSGNSRHGGIAVNVVVINGKISSVAITSCQTRYPCSQITPLRAQVLSRQSAKIDHVSGATDSSTAYRQAVAAALVQAT